MLPFGERRRGERRAAQERRGMVRWEAAGRPERRSGRDRRLAPGFIRSWLD